MKDLETVISAFITSRLGNRNSIYLVLPKSALKRLQLVQNVAARLLSGARKHEHRTLAMLILRFRSFFFKALQ